MTHQFFIQVNFCFKFLGAFKTFVLFLYVPFECNLIIWHRTLGINFMQFHCCVTMLHTNKNKNYFNDRKLWRSEFYILFSLTSSFSIIIINLCITKYFAKHFQLCMHDQAIFTQKQEQGNFTKVSKNIFPLKSLLFKIDSVLSEKKSKMFRLNSKFTNDKE